MKQHIQFLSVLSRVLTLLLTVTTLVVSGSFCFAADTPFAASYTTVAGVTTEYATFDSAVQAAYSDPDATNTVTGVIKLLQNWTIEPNSLKSPQHDIVGNRLNSCIANNVKSVAYDLDLNGHTLTNNTDDNLFFLCNFSDETITIRNGTYIGNGVRSLVALGKSENPTPKTGEGPTVNLTNVNAVNHGESPLIKSYFGRASIAIDGCTLACQSDHEVIGMGLGGTDGNAPYAPALSIKDSALISDSYPIRLDNVRSRGSLTGVSPITDPQPRVTVTGSVKLFTGKENPFAKSSIFYKEPYINRTHVEPTETVSAAKVPFVDTPWANDLSCFQYASVDGTCGDHLTWSLDTTGNLTITGTGAMYDGWSYPNYAPWYSYNSSIKSVIIGNGVTTIEANAFHSCYNLKDVTIPNSVTTIGDYAFSGCDSLTSVTIPASVTMIGFAPFCMCESLQTLTVISSNPNYSSADGVLFNKDKTELICYPAGKSATNYDMPISVKTLQNNAFYGCTRLKSIRISSNIQDLGANTFMYSGLTSVTIPKSCTSMGGFVFADCPNLTAIYVESGNPRFRSVNGILYDIGSNRLVQYPAGKKTARTYQPPKTVDGIAITGVYFGSFRGCSYLTSITLPEGITMLGRSVFYGCSDLTSLNIPSSVNFIENFTFYGCTALKEIVIPDGVTTIGDCAFEDCTSLTSLTIPSSVTTIGNAAFFHCTSLMNVYYTGTEVQWYQITIGDGNDCLQNAAIHYCVIPAEGISLNKEELHLEAGKSETLLVTILPDDATDKTVTWSSNAENVATVSGGVVTAKSAGTATITATAGGKSATCTVTVTAAQTLPTEEPPEIDKTKPYLEASKIRTVAGRTVEVAVSVANNPGIWGIDAKIGYDKTVLTLTEVKNGEIFADGELTSGVLDNVPYTLSYEKSDFSNTDKNGVLATLTFAVKDGAALGDYPITVSYAPGDCVNADEQKVSFQFADGGVTVVNVIYGDVNMDTEVNKMDSLRLKKYLADQPVEIDLLAADVNVDGAVNKMDSLRLKKFLADQPVKLGEP